VIIPENIGGIKMKQYSKDFREQALELSDEIGLKKASEQLGVVYGTLSDWRKSRTESGLADPAEPVYIQTVWGSGYRFAVC
jgi:transposase-like protein